MSCYIITFQAALLETRQSIREYLKSYGSYCAIHNTCWAIVTDKKAAVLRDEIAKLVKPGDRVFVVRSGTEAAWRNIAGTVKTSDWLKRNL